MTKREKEIMNITLWKMARMYIRKTHSDKFNRLYSDDCIRLYERD